MAYYAYAYGGTNFFHINFRGSNFVADFFSAPPSLKLWPLSYVPSYTKTVNFYSSLIRKLQRYWPLIQRWLILSSPYTKKANIYILIHNWILPPSYNKMAYSRPYVRNLGISRLSIECFGMTPHTKINFHSLSMLLNGIALRNQSFGNLTAVSDSRGVQDFFLQIIVRGGLLLIESRKN